MMSVQRKIYRCFPHLNCRVIQLTRGACRAVSLHEYVDKNERHWPRHPFARRFHYTFGLHDTRQLNCDWMASGERVIAPQNFKLIFKLSARGLLEKLVVFFSCDEIKLLNGTICLRNLISCSGTLWMRATLSFLHFYGNLRPPKSFPLRYRKM